MRAEVAVFVHSTHHGLVPSTACPSNPTKPQKRCTIQLTRCCARTERARVRHVRLVALRHELRLVLGLRPHGTPKLEVHGHAPGARRAAPRRRAECTRLPRHAQSHHNRGEQQARRPQPHRHARHPAGPRETSRISPCAPRCSPGARLARLAPRSASRRLRVITLHGGWTGSWGLAVVSALRAASAVSERNYVSGRQSRTPPEPRSS
mmetsp:Transcript_40959/g.128373  ORF Transcript_40959/g.128373 Transcript_40959/m.128373 type:complete len:207 (-) Transcript_40959:31-651(-)